MGCSTAELMAIVCFAGGKAAFLDGEGRDVNPWDAGTPEHALWDLGWHYASRDVSLHSPTSNDILPAGGGLSDQITHLKG